MQTKTKKATGTENIMDELAVIHESVEALKAKLKKAQEKEEKAKEQVFGQLTEWGKDTYVHNGYVFKRSFRPNYEVRDEQKANMWALEKGCMRMDKTAANKLLAREVVTPEGFERIVNTSLIVNKAKDENED